MKLFFQYIENGMERLKIESLNVLKFSVQNIV